MVIPEQGRVGLRGAGILQDPHLALSLTDL
jgi:hypothetical protein